MTPDQHATQKDLVKASLLSQPVKPERKFGKGPNSRAEVEARMWAIGIRR